MDNKIKVLELFEEICNIETHYNIEAVVSLEILFDGTVRLWFEDDCKEWPTLKDAVAGLTEYLKGYLSEALTLELDAFTGE